MVKSGSGRICFTNPAPVGFLKSKSGTALIPTSHPPRPACCLHSVSSHYGRSGEPWLAARHACTEIDAQKSKDKAAIWADNQREKEFIIVEMENLDSQPETQAWKPPLDYSESPLDSISCLYVSEVVALVGRSCGWCYWSKKVRLTRITCIAQEIPSSKLTSLETSTKATVAKDGRIVGWAEPPGYNIDEMELWAHNSLHIKGVVTFTISEELRILPTWRLNGNVRTVQST